MASFKVSQPRDAAPPRYYRTPSPPLKSPSSPNPANQSRPFLFGASDNATIARPATHQAPMSASHNRSVSADTREASIWRGNSHGVTTKVWAQPVQSPMDAFAEIALATSPTFGPTGGQTTFAYSTTVVSASECAEEEERPSKRARSEVPFSRRLSLSTSRPATSYVILPNQQPDAKPLDPPSANPVPQYQQDSGTDSRTNDAELLLSVSRAVFTSHQANGLHSGHSINNVNVQAERHPAHGRGTSPRPVVETSQRSGISYGGGPHSHNATLPASPQSRRVEIPSNDGIFNVPLMTKPPIGRRQTVQQHSTDLDTNDITTDSHQCQSTPTRNVAPSASAGTASVKASTIGTEPKSTLKSTSAKASDLDTAQAARCAGCEMIPNSLQEKQIDEVSWINCDGCKSWFHYACAGLTEKEVRTVDKYSCPKCWHTRGPTTYVRKSSRAHTSIDYAGLNEGVIKTSDESPDHPYIRPIKERTIRFQLEKFPRMPPELVTLDFFEKGNGMKEPIVIPAWMNPQREVLTRPDSMETMAETPALSNHVLSQDYEYEEVPDHGEDLLGMVIPRHLTVRQVAELYGPEEKVPVIDVKSQGEAGSWNMQKWADYYESREKKFIRNVISLEVSLSKLGRLIKRPKVVQQLDLVDSVWPADLKAKGEFPRVQLYCLMSIADSYTDFHIDFGGSSVFYHILKGKKTFLFIPPKSKHLKKYEQWCLSPAQNHTFLPDQTKECYRVDLSAGDTMLIPSGWIHAVWTPEDSLVIGGNFMTRLHYGTQIQIAEIEKATKVPRRFRQPHFQKILWFAAIRYLVDDPIPPDVMETLCQGQQSHRETPIHYEFDAWGDNSKPGPENHHAKYYSQYELEGLPHLARYLLRTALISMGNITDGITVETRNAVTRAIPKGHGSPLGVVKKFAIWSAWKRGNEVIPSWAYPDAVPTEGAPVVGEKKLSAAAMRRLEREAAIQAYRVVPERQSERKQTKATTAKLGASPDGMYDESKSPSGAADATSNAPQTTITSATVEERKPSVKRKAADMTRPVDKTGGVPKTSPGGSAAGSKGVVCKTCKKRRSRCKHRNDAPVEPDVEVPMDKTDSESRDVVAMEEPGRSSSLNSGLIKSEAADMVKTSSPTREEEESEPPVDSTGNKKAKSKACDRCRKAKVCPSNTRIEEPDADLRQRRCHHNQADGVVSAGVPEWSGKPDTKHTSQSPSSLGNLKVHPAKKARVESTKRTLQSAMDAGPNSSRQDTSATPAPTYQQQSPAVSETLRRQQSAIGEAEAVSSRVMHGDDMATREAVGDSAEVVHDEVMRPLMIHKPPQPRSAKDSSSGQETIRRSDSSHSTEVGFLNGQVENHGAGPLSPPSSPLSDIDSSKAPSAPSQLPNESPLSKMSPSRRSSRKVTSVNVSATPIHNNPTRSPRSTSKRVAIQTPPVSLINGKSMSPELTDHRARGTSGKPRGGRTPTPRKATPNTAQDGTRTSPTTSKVALDPEEESLQLAKQLAFGLRRSSAR